MLSCAAHADTRCRLRMPLIYVYAMLFDKMLRHFRRCRAADIFHYDVVATPC